MSRNVKIAIAVAVVLAVALAVGLRLRGGGGKPAPAPVVFRCEKCGKVFDDLPPEMEIKAKAGQLRCPDCGGRLRAVPAEQVEEASKQTERTRR